MRVLLVEDDVAVSRSIQLMLAARGAVVDKTVTGEEAVDLVKHYEYDIVILDIMLPDTDGYEVIRRIRNSKLDVPIMVISGMNRMPAKIKAFSIGADEYITKPFDKEEFISRILAVTRRWKGFSQAKIIINNIELNTENKEMYVDGKKIHLTGKEYMIMELLMLKKNTIISKEIFLNHLYGGVDEPEMKIIDVFICKLRKKLKTANVENIIGTVWGRGYTIRESVNHERNSDFNKAREYVRGFA
ncbi:MAG: response regulator transcription factor [Rhodospirillales bacterium]|nr:response regulator transcription factor [Rhodospirillales bacterium]MDE2200657.1 response regulator transcription factor [Rhodospirillales bacterium]